MRPLVAVRRKVPFDPAFIGRHPLLWPLARAAGTLGRWDDFPPVEALGGVFDQARGDTPVRFVRAAPRRRRGAPVDPRMLYDARIVLEAQVPTRDRCWHDLMNALVWGTFPRSKFALHARQHRAITQRLSSDACRLPATRSRELDALALVDEGGVVLLTDDATRLRALREQHGPAVWGSMLASGEVDAVVFGHAIYESLVLGVKPAVVAAVVVEREPAETDLVCAADRGLAPVIDDTAFLRSPDELGRVDLPQMARSRSALTGDPGCRAAPDRAAPDRAADRGPPASAPS